MKNEYKKIQVVECKCGMHTQIATYPDHNTDKDWQKILREANKKGLTVKIIEKPQLNFGSCECNKRKEQKVTQQTLFE